MRILGTYDTKDFLLALRCFLPSLEISRVQEALQPYEQEVLFHSVMNCAYDTRTRSFLSNRGYSAKARKIEYGKKSA